MKRPVIAVLSRSPQFLACVCPPLERLAEVEVCSDLETAETLIRNRPLDGLVVDFFETSREGLREARLLFDFRRLNHQGTLVVATARRPPQPVKEQALRSDVLHLSGVLAAEKIREWFEQRLDVPQPNSPDVPEDLREDVGGQTVLHGITRRFETNVPRLRRMLEELEVAAQHDVTILLIGETGSGKTYLSSLIHEVSPRRNEPFLPVACGALPGELIESELFGHVKGAFTSAHADKEGKFIAAGRGTILLDEIDVLGVEQQVKLLRVIETGEFEPVGSNKTLKCEARLVVASNQQLEPLVEQGKFRPDLYYRLNMLKFEIPPLRERRADIVMLAHKLVRQLSSKHGIRIERVDRDFYEALLNYPWPGNVRELENVVQRAVIFCRGGVLTVEHLPPHVAMGIPGPASSPAPEWTASGSSELTQQIAMTEREIIQQALARNNYCRTHTARELGISRVTLYNKMKKYGMLKK